jgi:hypothetical protein
VTVVEEDAKAYLLSAGRSGLRSELPDGSGGQIRIDYDQASLVRRGASVHTSLGRSRVAVTGWLGSVLPAGRDSAGAHYVEVSELVTTARGNGVDLTIQRLPLDGARNAVARVPVRGRAASPHRAVTIAPDGDAYAIFPEERRTLILRLPWSERLTALAPSRRLDLGTQHLALAANQIPVCRSSCLSTAMNYYIHNWWCSTQNFSTCGGSVRPRYITSANAWYGEIPYNWGGWCTVVGFDNAMSSGYSAGNISTNFTTCTEGVDCSGFIQRCWGISDGKKDDTMLTAWVTNRADIDPNNPPPWMQHGDMYRLPGLHASMHDTYSSLSTGPYVYESAAANGDRVWYTFYSWTALDSYEWNIANFTC